ncbi:hypothetical protein DPMN_005098 [Dreissena polymorpha]|uniref:Uncharacterized protein n=1 Tax=Dreissena polymorpha TaxID=45954 RepID=A0A9D4RW63_DREPO|nr:hypothetical protein DPMN_005098 [Dreissena polymorpha]
MYSGLVSDRNTQRTSRLLTRLYYSHIKKNAKCPPPDGHVFQPFGTIFKLAQIIIWTNLPTKFHENRPINVACRMLTMHMLTMYSRQRTTRKCSKSACCAQLGHTFYK